MTMKTRGFLLFGFAFASVLSSSEVLTSTKNTSSRTVQPLTTDIPSTVFKESQTQAVDHDLKKRAIEIYQQSAYPKTSDNEKMENAFATDKKRESRFRFTGMRGKKDYENEYVESYPVVGMEKVESPVDKKAEEELYENKRAPLTFHGMRGKKFEDLDSKKTKSGPSDFNSLSSIQKYLINSRLIDDMNVPELDYFEHVVTGQDKDWDSSPFAKRLPYSFQGMRGKKDCSYDLKRSLGFMGMRGKKNNAEAWSRYFGYKRVPQTSFFGMKGKKAQSGFFGMRGKKSEEGSHELSALKFQDSGLFDVEEESPINRFQREIGPKI